MGKKDISGIKLTSPDNEELPELAIRFFKGEQFLPLMPYIYSDDPKGVYPVKATKAWDDLTVYDPYYLSRCELALIQSRADDITRLISKHIPDKPNIMDLGAAGLKKIFSILDSFVRNEKDIGAYIPVDISETFLMSTTDDAKQSFPKIRIQGLVADFYNYKPEKKLSNNAVFFFGSSIGNIPEHEGTNFFNNTVSKLKGLRSLVGDNGMLIIGQDYNQDQGTLLRAYDNNILYNHVLQFVHRVKWDVPSKGINPESYSCSVEWVPEDHRVSYYAVPEIDQTVTINGKDIFVPKGKKLHIGNSYKFPIDQFQEIGRQAGYEALDVFEDSSDRMAIHVWKCRP